MWRNLSSSRTNLVFCEALDFDPVDRSGNARRSLSEPDRVAVRKVQLAAVFSWAQIHSLRDEEHT